MATKGWGVIASLAIASTVACGSESGGGERATAVAQRDGAATIVSITFDDANADQLQAAAMLGARGMRGTFFVPSGRVGAKAHMTWGDLAALQAEGHEIGGHTIDHVNLTTLDASEARREVCDDRDRLMAAGLAVSDFAYPFGAHDADVEAIVAGCGYDSARLVSGLAWAGGCANCPYANPIPPRDPYALRAPQSIAAETTLEAIEAYVTQAEQHGGGWVPITIHHVCDCADASITPARLGAFLDWLATRAASGTVVRTVREAIGGSVAPPPNLFANGSLEDDADGDGTPDCWKRTGFGTATYSWTTTSDAHDGASAQELHVTSIASGARRLVSKQDSGACAPAAAPGDSFDVSAWYHATVPAQLAAYYRDPDGRWVWWAESPRFPATDVYTQASWTIPALPDGATAVSVALGITQPGSITMDSFELQSSL